MKTITEQKQWEELMEMLKGVEKLYLIGCGTCSTMVHTGGKSEVIAMKKKLEEAGKQVTGWMVVPNPCDELTRDALKEEIDRIKKADGILALTCAMGVQMIGLHSDKIVYPALNTVFVGQEEGPGQFIEVCEQCGSCVLGRTAGICPVVRCAKGLLNGPCGGSVKGKCEVSPDVPCAWQLIYDRLAKVGQLDKLDEIAPLKDWSKSRSGGPRKITVKEK